MKVKRMRDNEHPFFRPLWRRLLIIAVCIGWAIFEFAMGAQTWGFIALAFTGYGVWQFLLNYKPPAEAGDPKE